MYRQYKLNPFQLIIGLLILFVILAFAFYVAKGIFNLLMYATPVLVFLTLLIDYRVIINYGKWLITKFSTNPLNGVVWTLLSIFGFPIVAAYWVFKALINRQAKRMEKEWNESNGEYIEYEEVEDIEEFELIENQLNEKN